MYKGSNTDTSTGILIKIIIGGSHHGDNTKPPMEGNPDSANANVHMENTHWGTYGRGN